MSYHLKAFLVSSLLVAIKFNPWNMHGLHAIKASNAANPLLSPVAVFVGGTAGIGAAMAVKTATYSKKPNIHIVGRNAEAADRIISQMKAVNPDGEYHFHKSDVSLLSESRSLAANLTKSLPKINHLVLSPGMLSVAGRTETSEGNDVKMVLHYYTRVLFVRELLPSLTAAVSAGEDARVISVLDSLRGNPSKLRWEDLDLKHNYGLAAAAEHCMAMTDVTFQRFARLYPSISFMHLYPSLVATDITRSLPWYLSGPTNSLAKVIGSSAENVAEWFFDVMRRPDCKTGVHFLDNKGKEIKGKVQSSEDMQEKVWKHTEGIMDGAKGSLMHASMDGL